MSKKPTMSQIAALCDVSQATVSLVLNNASGTRISPDTRERVLKVAEEVGYAKSSAKNRKPPVVALVMDDVTATPMAPGLIEGVMSAAEDRGYLGMMAMPGRDGLEQLLATVSKSRLAGVIYGRLITQPATLPEILSDIPTVMLNCWAEGESVPSVLPSDMAGAMRATLALIDAGHSRIACVGGESTIMAARERRKGYRTALATKDIPVDPVLIRGGAYSIAGGFASMNDLLALDNPPTAVFCYTDRTALGVYQACTRHGLRIPEDISVIGFDNESYSASMVPPLTTMELPHSDMGEQAVAMLAELTGGGGAHLQQKIECPMVERKSVAPPSH